MKVRSRASSASVSSSIGSLWLAAACSLLLVVLVRTAWVCDDAYITFRTVDNLVSGYGPRWNVGERVQAYTHPLWMLVVSPFYAITGEPYFTVLALSIAISLAAVYLLLRRAQSLATMILCAALVVSSKAFIDFSTSGLENPLSHLWLALAAPFVFREQPTTRDVRLLSLFTSLAILTRLDSGLLLAPCLLGVVLRVGWRASITPLAIGLLPAVAWHLFALVYYGALLPNTVYAKLKTGVPASELAMQGFFYLGDSLAQDPVTLPVIGLAFVACVVQRRPASLLFALGLLLHLTYIVRVGGDFMSGRFLTAPFFWSVLFVSRLPVPAPAWALPLPLLAVLAIGQLGAAYPLWSDGSFGPEPGRPRIPQSGVTDERRFYYPTTGLLRWNQLATPPITAEPERVQRYLAEGRTVAPRDSVGFFGYSAGRQLHIVDVLGLGDPLLARLPTERPWRIGHFYRKIPAGYEASVTGANQIEDASIARYYDDVALVVRGPLFSWERWKAIARLQLGMDERFLDAYRIGLKSLRASAVPSTPPADGAGATPLIDVGTGVRILLPTPTTARAVEAGLDQRIDYRITLLRQGEPVHSVLTRAENAGAGGLSPRRVDVPASAGAIDAIDIIPRRGDPPYRLSHLRIEGVGGD
jgi:arabinofuranosyltransferase